MADLEILRKFEAEWGVTVAHLLPNPSYGLVGFGTRGNQEVVLKLARPGPEFDSQVRALSVLSNKQSVRMLESDLEAGALLLERIFPGTSLWQTWTPEDDDLHTTLLAQWGRDISLEPASGFPTVSDWMEAFERYADRYPAGGPIRIDYLIRARETYNQLCGPGAPAPRLLHGDLHHGNLLDAGRSWKAIDPKGVVGDPAFEVYAMIRNPHDRFSPDNANLDRRLRIFAETARLDEQRLRCWAYVGCVLSACWSIEDGEEGWEHALACADALTV